MLETLYLTTERRIDTEQLFVSIVNPQFVREVETFDDYGNYEHIRINEEIFQNIQVIKERRTPFQLTVFP